jgi:hypothetical protein
MANTERARKLLVRSMIATSTTVSTLFGAQMLATIDLAKVSASSGDMDQSASVDVQPVEELILSTPTLLPTVIPPTQSMTYRSAPSITILRQPGQVTSRTQSNENTVVEAAPLVIQPPNPVAVAQPDPIIVPAPESQAQPQIIQQQPQQRVVVVRRQSSSNNNNSSSNNNSSNNNNNNNNGNSNSNSSR